MSGLPEMPCAEFVERVTDYLEGAMSEDDLVRLEQHLATCSHCALYLAQLQQTLALSGELREADVSPNMRASLLGAFTDWKRGAAPGPS